MLRNIYNGGLLGNCLLMEEAGGATPPPGGGGTPPATPPPADAITVEQAAEVITKAGGVYFADQEAAGRFATERGSDLIKDEQARLYKRFDENINSTFGVQRNTDEDQAAYLKRAQTAHKESVIASNPTDEEQKKAFQTINTTNLDRIKTLEGSIETMKGQNVTNEIDALKSKGMSTLGLGYTGLELEGVQNAIDKRIGGAFEFVKDDKGLKAINRATGEVELDQNGNRKTIDLVVSGFGKGIEGLKFAEQGGGGTPQAARLPAGGTGNPADMTAAEKEVVLKRVKEKAAEKGLFGHEKEFWEIAKTEGYPISDKIKKQFNF